MPISFHKKPLCVDLYCGLGGWTEGFLAEGWGVIGFDIERHVYGEQRYPAQLVLQDVLTLHGSQFKEADCLVFSPPCQEYSYMAMPWKRGKQIAAALRGERTTDANGKSCPIPFPEPYTGSRTRTQLTALFGACFRIQREACEASGRHIPMVVENVNGAQPWVGPAKANFGSFYFWGDIAMVGGAVVAGPLQFGNVAKAARRGMKRNPDGTEHPQGSWFAVADSKERGTKNTGGSWFDVAHNTESGTGRNPVNGSKGFVTGLGMGHDWRQDPSARFNSKSDSRKAASAQIAKIPLPLSSYVARCFRPAGPTASERSA